MTDRFVTYCPYCGGTEMIETCQSGYGAISSTQNAFCAAALYHVVCRNCGSVARSYVKNPEKLIKKKDRRTTS